MTSNLNILAAWLGIVVGVLAGVAPGLAFHRDDWLGGYASWRRRLVRLGHVSFFGIAFLNLAFAWTVHNPGWRPVTSLPAAALCVAQGLMPLVCYLAAWRPPLRRWFFLPVGCVPVGAGPASTSWPSPASGRAGERGVRAGAAVRRAPDARRHRPAAPRTGERGKCVVARECECRYSTPRDE